MQMLGIDDYMTSIRVYNQLVLSQFMLKFDSSIPDGSFTHLFVICASVIIIM